MPSLVTAILGFRSNATPQLSGLSISVGFPLKFPLFLLGVFFIGPEHFPRNWMMTCCQHDKKGGVYFSRN